MAEIKNGVGDFLRSRRERLTPEAVGLPAGPRRRTPGLRREEVAELAGISVDWYIRLEQGRSVTPSLMTVNAIARALRLDPLEAGHLRDLALQNQRRPFAREQVPDEVRRMVAAMNLPAYVTGRRWDVLAWNCAADDLLGPFSETDEAERNSLLMMLARPKARALFGETWEQEARRMVAQFRATHDFWISDPAFVDLLTRLRASCPEFLKWWETHDIGNTPSGVKFITRPARGVVRYAFSSFQLNADPSLRLSVYTELPDPGSPGA